MQHERPAWAGGSDMPQQLPQHKAVNIDVGEFIRTRDALTSAYLGLSASLDRAVKSYLDHTQVVLNGDSSLNVSHLLQPFNLLTNHAQMAQLALQQGNGGMPMMFPNGGSQEPDGKKKRKKRNYKQRDPNAPKRPLTAYFRYLGENRAAIQQEIQSNPDLYQTPGKPGDISRIATDRWNALSKDEQEPYRKAYQDALKDYEKDVAAYKAGGGAVGDTTAIDDTNIDASHVQDDEKPATATVEEEDESDSSSDSSSSEESDEEEAAPPPPPPAKTPKSALKKGKQANAQPAQTFSTLNPVETASASASSPTRKRKAGSEEEITRKKRSGRSAGEAATSPLAPAPVAPMAAASPEAAPASDASKKKKKDKKKK